MTCVDVSIRMSRFESGEFVVFRMRIHDRVASISELSSSTLDYVSKDPSFEFPSRLFWSLHKRY